MTRDTHVHRRMSDPTRGHLRIGEVSSVCVGDLRDRDQETNRHAFATHGVFAESGTQVSVEPTGATPCIPLCSGEKLCAMASSSETAPAADLKLAKRACKAELPNTPIMRAANARLQTNSDTVICLAQCECKRGCRCATKRERERERERERGRKGSFCT